MKKEHFNIKSELFLFSSFVIMEMRQKSTHKKERL